MGENLIDSILYAINNETGEKNMIGKGITKFPKIPKLEIPKLAPGGIIDKEPVLTGGYRCSSNFTIKLKNIKKKRFIKLLMSKGYQKNKALEMHKEYMKLHTSRSRIGLELFVMTYGIKLNEFKIKVGGRF